MRRVERADPPEEFDRRVGQPGQRALLELIGSDQAPKRRGRKREKVADRVEDIPGDELPTFWTEAIPMLQAAYADTCAYLGLRINPATGHPTVDHFVPKVADPKRAYDWDNFRLATGQMNANKGAHRDVLDPFDIRDGDRSDDSPTQAQRSRVCRQAARLRRPLPGGSRRGRAPSCALAPGLARTGGAVRRRRASPAAAASA